MNSEILNPKEFLVVLRLSRSRDNLCFSYIVIMVMKLRTKRMNGHIYSIGGTRNEHRILVRNHNGKDTYKIPTYKRRKFSNNYRNVCQTVEQSKMAQYKYT
jgi:hypothetical protein